MPLPPDFAAHYETARQAFTEARLAFLAAEAEMRAYDRIAALYDKARVAPEPADAPNPRRPHRRRQDRRRKPQHPGLRDKARAIFLALAAIHPRTYDTASLVEAVSRAGHQTSPDALRSSLATYVTRGLVERVSPGVFKITSAGAAAVGMTLRE